MHIHVDPVQVLVTGCTIVIFGFFWRTVSYKLADRPIGQAMAFIF